MSVINRLREGLIAFILIAVLVVVSSNKAYSLTYCSNCREADSLALVALYHATDGPHWVNNTNWLVTGQPINTWKGVTASPTGRVLTLDLTGNNLKDTLPAELSNLTGLRYLILTNNNLSGAIPYGLANNTSLKSWFDYNHFNFSDIANSGFSSSNTRFIYYPQLPQPAPKMDRNGESVILTIGDRFSGNHYKWYSDGILIQTDDSYTYSFITDRATNINALIKNNSYPNLDLETYKVLVEPIMPELVIINPGSVCFPNTVDITGDEITQGSTASLEFTYFRDANASDQMTLEEAQAIAVSGTYYIKGTNDGGQSDIKPVEVVVNSNPEVSGLVYDVTCAGGDNGSVDITVIGGKAPYTFNWSTGLQEEDLNNISKGSYQVAVTDGNNCSATSTFVVNQNDSELPIISAKDIILQLDETGNASITADDINNGSADNCGIASMVVSQTSFSCSNIGENIDTLIVTDVNGNISKATFTVMVEDKTAPVVFANNITLQLDETGNASITAEDINNSSTDNCGIASMVISQSSFSCSKIGENIDTLIVTDVNGNISKAVFTVNVEDKIAPVVVTNNITLQLDENGSASLTAEDVNNGSTDNCRIASMVISQTSFSCENTGDNNVTLTITDASGNVSTGDAVVKVIDLIAPSITAPASVSITVKEGEVPVVELGSPVTSDNCGIKEVTNDAPQAFAEGLTVVTWSVTDNSENVSTAVQHVEIIVQHNQLPEILSMTSNTPVELGEASEMEAEFRDDNLKSATFNWGDGATSNGNIVGQKIYGTHVYAEEGEYTVTLSIIDEAGETASIEYVNTVVDNTSSGGHITGGGWINSAGGDYKQSKRSDKGNFGFEVQSDKKRGIRGNFTFNLHNTNFRVRSNNIDWLTINDDHALFAGSASVNGRSGYEFLVSAVDVDMNRRCRDNDLLRLMVWDGRGNLIYDNQQGSGNMERPVNQIGHGSIVIHKQKDIYCQNFKSASISEEEVSPIETSLFENIKVYPNPAVNVLNIELPGREEEIISYDIFDVTGRVIASNRNLEMWGQNSWIDLEELGIKQGMYVLKLKGGDDSEVGVVRFMKE